jgi:hypothetical protein
VLYQTKEDTNISDSYRHVSESKEKVISASGEYFITVSLISSGYTQSCIYPFEYGGISINPSEAAGRQIN